MEWLGFMWWFGWFCWCILGIMCLGGFMGVFIGGFDIGFIEVIVLGVLWGFWKEFGVLVGLWWMGCLLVLLCWWFVYKGCCELDMGCFSIGLEICWVLVFFLGFYVCCWVYEFCGGGVILYGVVG